MILLLLLLLLQEKKYPQQPNNAAERQPNDGPRNGSGGRNPSRLSRRETRRGVSSKY